MLATSGQRQFHCTSTCIMSVDETEPLVLGLHMLLWLFKVLPNIADKVPVENNPLGFFSTVILQLTGIKYRAG